VNFERLIQLVFFKTFWARSTVFHTQATFNDDTPGGIVVEFLGKFPSQPLFLMSLWRIFSPHSRKWTSISARRRLVRCVASAVAVLERFRH